MNDQLLFSFNYTETAIGLKRDVQNDKDNEYLKSVDM